MNIPDVLHCNGCNGLHAPFLRHAPQAACHLRWSIHKLGHCCTAMALHIDYDAAAPVDGLGRIAKSLWTILPDLGTIAHLPDIIAGASVLQMRSAFLLVVFT